MHLDSHGLPQQKSGDRNDQLQRVGMIATGSLLKWDLELLEHESVWTWLHMHDALEGPLQPRPGTYTRYVGGDPANVSADQLISALAYWVVSANVKQVLPLLGRMILRLGFAQNYVDGIDKVSTKAKTNEETSVWKALSQGKWKLPDFMLIRALPLFARTHAALYPVAIVADLFLLLSALFAIGPVFRDDSLIPRKRGPDDVDDNVIILTLAVCRARMPTPLSILSAKLYAWARPWNYGCADEVIVDADGEFVALRNGIAYGPHTLPWADADRLLAELEKAGVA